MALAPAGTAAPALRRPLALCHDGAAIRFVESGAEKRSETAIDVVFWRVYVDGVEVKANGDEHEAENEQAEGQGAVCPKVLFGLRQRAMRFSRATAVDH